MRGAPFLVSVGEMKEPRQLVTGRVLTSSMNPRGVSGLFICT